MIRRVALLALPLLASALAGCLGSGGEDRADSASTGDGGFEDRLHGYSYSSDAEGNMVMSTDKPNLIDTTRSMDFGEANLMATGNAARYQDAEWNGSRASRFSDRESRYARQNSRFEGMESRYADNRNRWNDSRFEEGGRTFASRDFDGQDRSFATGRSRYEGEVNRNSEQRNEVGSEAIESPDVPQIIRSLGHGSYVGNSQVRALTGSGSSATGASTEIGMPGSE